VNIWSIFDLVTPACLVCGLATGQAGLLCAGCLADLRARPARLRCAHAVAARRGLRCLRGGGPGTVPPPSPPLPVTRFPVDALVRQLKFDGRLPVARACSAAVLLARVRQPHDGDAAATPRCCRCRCTRRVERERGYNQAERIAAPLAKCAGHPAERSARRDPRCIATARAVAHGSRPAPAEPPRTPSACTAPLPPHVAIVDDVMTSGSTLQRSSPTRCSAQPASRASRPGWSRARSTRRETTPCGGDRAPCSRMPR
jgi:predicted amidophosphoribosyltransferase